MGDEDGFLQKLRDNPADDTTRLVYADWLDERGDAVSGAKAEFLRLTVRLLEPNRSAGWRKGRRQDLQPLAAALPTEWLAVVSRLKIENCAGKRAEARNERRLRQLFEFVCEKRWDELTATDDDAVRFCGQCKETVHYCDTIADARQSAELGRCIAVDLGVIRRHDDLSPRRYWAGRPSAEMLRKEEERCQIDAVSQAREEAKRKQRGDAAPQQRGDAAPPVS
ncbi:TIGR02996 domain-containing protein [Gemmata sp.]|uniref:TIGR02996 domain-containing protein n=1 Tax=Gemmata sp. TaxID=1914242 RepID=UPI003F6F96B2